MTTHPYGACEDCGRRDYLGMVKGHFLCRTCGFAADRDAYEADMEKIRLKEETNRDRDQ